MLTKEQQRVWAAALRSGEFKQGRAQLYCETDNTYCCLGVLGNAVLERVPALMDNVGYLHYVNLDDYSLEMFSPAAGATEHFRGERIFTHANDMLRLNFLQIAHLVEHLPTVD